MSCSICGLSMGTHLTGCPNAPISTSVPPPPTPQYYGSGAYSTSPITSYDVAKITHILEGIEMQLARLNDHYGFEEKDDSTEEVPF